MYGDGLPAQSATAISRLVLIWLIHNIFTLSKKQQKSMSVKNKNFAADGSEYNAVVDFLLFV